MRWILPIFALAISGFAPFAHAAKNEPNVVGEDDAGKSPYSQTGRLLPASFHCEVPADRLAQARVVKLQ
jgi:hypothetical protein